MDSNWVVHKDGNVYTVRGLAKVYNNEILQERSSWEELFNAAHCDDGGIISAEDGGLRMGIFGTFSFELICFYQYHGIDTLKLLDFFQDPEQKDLMLLSLPHALGFLANHFHLSDTWIALPMTNVFFYPTHFGWRLCENNEIGCPWDHRYSFLFGKRYSVRDWRRVGREL